MKATSRGEELGAGKGSSRRSEEEDSEGGHDGSPAEHKGNDENPQGVRALPPIGHLAFFVANSVPFVAVELLETLNGDNGTIEVHLLRCLQIWKIVRRRMPASIRLRNIAYTLLGQTTTSLNTLKGRENAGGYPTHPGSPQ